MRTDRVQIVSTVTSQLEAAAIVQNEGDIALVVRGVPRMMVMKCPCGCGDNLIINLDCRSGRAWRHYFKEGLLSLYPSYWRDSHCESHFILWNNRIYWCDYEGFWSESSDTRLEENVLKLLQSSYVSYFDIAEQLEEIPWDVLNVCRSLARQKKAERHWDHQRSDEFRRL